MAMKCPGQDRYNWRPEDLTEATCPQCGETVEFMKDDLSRDCPGCGTRFGDPGKDMGCIHWCKMAEKCLGVKPGSGLMRAATAAEEGGCGAPPGHGQ